MDNAGGEIVLQRDRTMIRFVRTWLKGRGIKLPTHPSIDAIYFL